MFRPFVLYLGGWTLVHNITLQTSQPFQIDLQTNWKSISNYATGKLALTGSALGDLMIKMPFEQMRFYCFKKMPGRIFHIATNANKSGNDVIRYFTAQTDVFPESCGSYVPLIDDNSQLSPNCAKWKWNSARWGEQGVGQNHRLINHLAFISGQYHWNTLGTHRWECDDNENNVSAGDYWKIFVR